MAPPPPDADRNFDDIAERFVSQIYGTLKGQLRLDIVLDDLSSHMPDLMDRHAPRQLIVDAGGGCGQLSASLAAAGHRVILCDISAVMLEKVKLINTKNN